MNISLQSPGLCFTIVQCASDNMGLYKILTFQVSPISDWLFDIFNKNVTFYRWTLVQFTSEKGLFIRAYNLLELGKHVYVPSEANISSESFDW